MSEPMVIVPMSQYQAMKDAADEITRLHTEIAYADEHAAKIESLFLGTVKERDALRAEVEKWKTAHAKSCDLAERHMNEKQALRALNAEMLAALDLADAVWPLAYKEAKASPAGDFSDETLRAWRAYERARLVIIAKAEKEPK